MQKTTISYSAGGVVMNQLGEVVVVNQNHDSWSLPKGHIDPGEDALTAAKREITEESGITNLDVLREIGTYERYKIGQQGGEDTSELKKITMFLFNTEKVPLVPQDTHNPEARWVKKGDVAHLLTHPKDKEFFIQFLKELNG